MASKNECLLHSRERTPPRHKITGSQAVNKNYPLINFIRNLLTSPHFHWMPTYSYPASTIRIVHSWLDTLANISPDKLDPIVLAPDQCTPDLAFRLLVPSKSRVMLSSELFLNKK